MKTLSLSLLTLSLASLTALAQTPIVNPATATQAINSLQSQVLSEEQVADLFDTRRKTAAPVSDLEFFATLKIAPPPSSEGVPSLANPPAPPMELINDAYTAPELIEIALQDRLNLDAGPRIRFLRNEASRIIGVSGKRPTEALLRVTLNRGVDVVNHVLPIMGQNSDQIALDLAGFLVENFQVAAAMGNNKFGVESRLTGNTSSTVTDYLKKVSIAEYGRIYASLLWGYTQGLSSESSKAVMLMRLVGYLGWDLNADLRRREAPIAKTIADIYRLQHGPLYEKLLRFLVTPKMATPAELADFSADVADFRRQVFSILQRLPGRLNEAGIITTTGFKKDF